LAWRISCAPAATNLAQLAIFAKALFFFCFRHLVCGYDEQQRRSPRPSAPHSLDGAPKAKLFLAQALKAAKVG
jgi:hypothetical protein